MRIINTTAKVAAGVALALLAFAAWLAAIYGAFVFLHARTGSPLAAGVVVAYGVALVGWGVDAWLRGRGV